MNQNVIENSSAHSLDAVLDINRTLVELRRLENELPSGSTAEINETFNQNALPELAQTSDTPDPLIPLQIALAELHGLENDIPRVLTDEIN